MAQPLTPEQIAELEAQRDTGIDAQTGYDSFFKDFISRKKILVFDDISTLHTNKTDSVEDLKRRAIIIKYLEEEILATIRIGEEAAQTLADNAA